MLPEQQPSEEVKFVYWEKQGKDRMWGLHWLNSLVQGPIFNESTLFETARKLDEEEKKLYGDDVPKISGLDGTNNIADDGNYNIQVLSKALSDLGNYNLVPIDSPEVRKSPMDPLTNETAFLWNSKDHWFAIRKIHGRWFNLNSTNMDPGPQIFSEFYLDAFLESVKDLGYFIHTVRGNDLPQPIKQDDVFSLRPNQLYVGLEYLDYDYQQNKGRALNTDGADQDDIQAAIKASLQDQENLAATIQPQETQEERDLRIAIEMSMGQENPWDEK